VNKDDEDGFQRWTHEAANEHGWSQLEGEKGRAGAETKQGDCEEAPWEPMEAIKKDAQ